MSAPQPEEILSFWFADAINSADAAKARGNCGSAAATPSMAKSKGASAICRSARRAAPRSALALALSLDQFPRNLFRDDRRAFEFDAKAREVALGAIAAGFDEKLQPIEAAFLYFPFEHAEDLELQNRSIHFFEKLCERAPVDRKAQFEEFADYARRHREVIRRFGRFPHRNALLGREPTEEESAYLTAGGERFSGKEDQP